MVPRGGEGSSRMLNETSPDPNECIRERRFCA
jgi:hypothetical protein